MAARPFDFADRAALAIMANLDDRRGLHVSTLPAAIRRQIRREFAVSIRIALLDQGLAHDDPELLPTRIMLMARDHVERPPRSA